MQLGQTLAGLTLQSDGLELRQALLDRADMDAAIAAVARASSPASGIRRADEKYPALAAIARNIRVRQLAEHLLGDRPRFIRAIWFDKTPDKNWSVSWHQDKTIVASRRVERPDWGPWTFKDRRLHVQPPQDVLDAVVTIRLHFDPATHTNGCLQVLAGSHRHGTLTPEQIQTYVRTGQPIACIADAGDAIAMRPLVLHASHRTTVPSHRRILHLEFGSDRVFQTYHWL